MSRRKKNARGVGIATVQAQAIQLTRDVAALKDRVDCYILNDEQRNVAGVLQVSFADVIAAKLGLPDHGGKAIDLINVLTANRVKGAA